ncbi:hypothetical protein [Haloferula sp. BvORR071]|uniref:hypothetical protein n=1 Tax=Haloferula sp. BvORR071 TaxID=1396141 RepID=UPI000696A4AE|nr:hypothetical protein [Haloferula sp. BvORR071]
MENLPPPNPYQAQEDASHLKLLAIFYFIFAGLGVLGTLGFLVFFIAGAQFMGDAGMQGSLDAQGAGVPPEVGWLFGGFGVVMLLFSAVVVLLDFLCGRWLLERKNRTFCIVVAALSCLSFPLGTALGVFTIIVLCRPSVIALFDRSLSPRR